MKESEDIPDDSEVFDVGPESAKFYDEIISRAGSVFWNGPMGFF
jgi:phosphoglycerate kinase